MSGPYTEYSHHICCSFALLSFFSFPSLFLQTKFAPATNGHNVPIETVERMLRQWQDDRNEVVVPSTRDEVATKLVHDAVSERVESIRAWRRDEERRRRMGEEEEEEKEKEKEKEKEENLVAAALRSISTDSSGGFSSLRTPSLRQRSLEAAQASFQRREKSVGSGRRRGAPSSSTSTTSTTSGSSLTSHPPANRRELSDEGKRLLGSSMPNAGSYAGSTKRKARVVYVAGCLTSATKHRVLSTIPPIHRNVIAQHVTLWFAPTEMEFVTHCLPSIGNIAVFHGTDVVANERCQALRVRNTESFQCAPGQHLHLTLSLTDGVPAVESNGLIQSTKDTAVESALLPLETITTVILRVGGRIIQVTEREELEMYQLSYSKQQSKRSSHPSPSSTSSEMQRSSEMLPAVSLAVLPAVSPVENIYVFDFDQTLFSTPDKKEWEKKKRMKWPSGASWPRDPRSLSGDMYQLVAEGPSFQDFQRRKDTIFRNSNSLVILLTGRPQCMEPYVRDIMQQFGVLSSFGRICCTPDKYGKKTASYKAGVVRQLLLEHKAVRKLECWDDDVKNLNAIRELQKERKSAATSVTMNLHHVTMSEGGGGGSSKGKRSSKGKGKSKGVSDPLLCVLRQQCLLSDELHEYTAREVLSIVGQAWAEVLLDARKAWSRRLLGVVSKEDGRRLVLPFGSYTYGRKGDLDLVVVGPNSLPAIHVRILFPFLVVYFFNFF